MRKVDDGLRPLFRKHLPSFHWQSIESGLVERGIPDSNYCAGGAEGWIEYKATSSNSLGLRPEQVGWLTTRRRHGGRAFVAVRKRTKTSDELYVYDAEYARELRDSGLRAAVPLLCHSTGGPSRWDWDAVRAVLTS